MAAPKYPGFDTLALHAGQSPDPATGARAVPVYQTTSYVFRDTEHAASLFNMERAGHVYSRISNPTVAVLEERMAALEGGVGAIATASGQAALHLAIATLMDAGSHIVASGSLYGGSHNLLAYTLKRFGIDTSFVSPHDPENFRRAIKPNTRLLFGETLGNPGLDVLDVPLVRGMDWGFQEEYSHPRGLQKADKPRDDSLRRYGTGSLLPGNLSRICISPSISAAPKGNPKTLPANPNNIPWIRKMRRTSRARNRSATTTATTRPRASTRARRRTASCVRRSTASRTCASHRPAIARRTTAGPIRIAAPPPRTASSIRAPASRPASAIRAPA